MKTFLYGTTALVASGMMVTAALAAQPISLKVNGFYDATLVVHDDDAPGIGDSTVKQDVEIQVNGSTVLDSGVTVGVQVEFKEPVAGGGLNNEEAFAYMEGSTGRGEIGSHKGAPFLMAYVAPSPTDGHGVDTPIFWHISRFSARTNARIDMSREANKVSYFTPRMSGFQLGASYTPSNDSNGARLGATPGVTGLGYANPAIGTGQRGAFGVRGDANGGIEDIIELGANYVGDYSGLGIKLSAGYAVGNQESFGLTPAGNGVTNPIAGDPEQWHFGGNFTYSGFTLGGAYFGSQNVIPTFSPTRSSRDEEAWNIGVTYAKGPWQVGAAWMDSEQKSATGAPGKNELTLADVGAQYKLGPGVAVSADFTWSEDDVAGPGTAISPHSIEDKAAALSLLLSF